jgi:tRNA A37 methylthiotransferase MiaB
MMIKVANEGHKMNSAGEYLEWTPFSSGAVNLEISRSRWAKMAATEDPTLENDIDQYLKAKRSKKEAEEHKKKAEVKNEYNSGEVIDLSVSESEQDDVFAHDPLKDVIKDTLPKKHVELQKYLAELHKAEESLNSQMEVVRATMVQVKYKLAHAK